MLADEGTEGPQLGCTCIQLDATKTSRLESLDQIKARLGPARSVIDADRLGRQREQHAVLIVEMNPVLAPVLTVRDELEVPAGQRMERVRHPDTSVPIIRMRCS